MSATPGNSNVSSALKGTIVLLTDFYGDYQKQLADPLRIRVNEAGYGLLVVAGAHVGAKSASGNARKSRNIVYETIKEYDATGIVVVVPSVCHELGSAETEHFIAGFVDIPLVCIGKSIPGKSCVLLDSRSGMKECMNHLLQAPENQVFCFLGGVRNNSDSVARENVFRQCVANADKPVDEELIIYGEFIAAKSYAAVVELLTRRRDIDVIVCANDESAQGAIYALEHMGLSVPDDVRVTGFDNHSIGTSSRPTISSVTQPQLEIAICATDTLLSVIETGKDSVSTKLITTQFIQRESTVCASQRSHRELISEEHYAQCCNELANSIYDMFSKSTSDTSIVKEALVRGLSQAAQGKSVEMDEFFKTRLKPSSMTRHDVFCWQNLAAIIEDFGTQLPDSNITDQLQACLFSHVRLIHETLRQWRVRQEFETTRLLQIYERFLTDVSAADSLHCLCEHLHRWFSNLGIERGFFAVYEEFGMQASSTARLACCHFSDRDLLPDNTQLFQTSDLLPATLQHHLRQGLLVLHSISADGLQFGHLLIDPSNIDSSKIDSGAIVSARLDAVVDGLGNAMLHIHQVNGMKMHADALEKANERLSNLANFDDLTQLPNRSYFQQNLQSVLSNAQRTRGAAALAFIDLDGFKVINDSLGHSEGDCLLRIVAERLLDVMGRDALIARLGGDEFTIIFHSQTGSKFVLSEALSKISEVLVALSKPYRLSNQSVNVSGSVGVAIYPNNAQDMETLIRKADSAMYHAKSCGKNCMRMYTPDLDREISWQLEQDQKMRLGLANNEFFMVFQPKYSLAKNTVAGVEALIRWCPDNKPGNSRLPSTFIPIAEKSGFVLRLDEFAMDSACEALARWQRQGQAVPIAVNVSASHVHKSGFVDMVADCIARHRIDPRFLEIEITESAAMENVERSIRQLTRLQNLGVSVAIDDFGVGYSSLAYLKRLPIDTLKIDQSFLDYDESDSEILAQNSAIAKAIIDLGRSMRFTVIVEGIEVEFQRDLVFDLGAHQGQGYFFSEPLLEGDLLELMHSERALAVT